MNHSNINPFQEVWNHLFPAERLLWAPFREFWAHILQTFTSLNSSESQETVLEPSVLLNGTCNAQEHYAQVGTWLTNLHQRRRELELNVHFETNNNDSLQLMKQFHNSHAQDLLYHMGFQFQRIPCNINNHSTNDYKYESSSEDYNSITHRTRLVHISSNTIITEENRREYIADGDMYEEMATLCQDYAQFFMSQEGSLKWIMISQTLSHTIPIMALVSSNHSDPKKTLVVITGKGKVAAGIFSRRHLITSSIEESSSWFLVHQAQLHNMNIVLLDPNARGDWNGMDTFTESMNSLFLHGPTNISIPPLFILAHSASGAQLVRYLMDHPHRNMLDSIQAVVFTDSTHNIQWVLNKDSQLYTWLQSPFCLYIRSTNAQRDYSNCDNYKAGDKCCVDSNWEHRFGKIQTLWAGTKDHSLCNWTARDCIWKQFLTHMDRDLKPN